MILNKIGAFLPGTILQGVHFYKCGAVFDRWDFKVGHIDILPVVSYIGSLPVFFFCKIVLKNLSQLQCIIYDIETYSIRQEIIND